MQSADDEVMRADEERERADGERKRADEERKRADEESKRADQETKRADSERARKEETARTQEPNAKSLREVKVALEAHRSRYHRGKNLWRTWFFLLVHILILSMAGAIFINCSETFRNGTSSNASQKPSDIVFALWIITVVALIFALEYLRNWWNSEIASIEVEKLIVELSEQPANTEKIRTKLMTIVENRRKFIRKIIK